jgi:SpoVK/Ycf46/Vps4 family AAA+-type ATPase
LKSNRNSLTFLKESFQSLKGLLEGNSSDGLLLFDKAFIYALRAELETVLQLCTLINGDRDLIEKMNLQVDPEKKNTLFYKTEHFFLSDVIYAYEKLLPKADEKSGFVLAYYYDVLRNDHFADEANILGFNALVKSSDFQKQLLKIRKENDQTGTKTPAVVLASAVQDQPDVFAAVLKHYGQFVESAFGMQFKQETDSKQFFGLETQTVSKRKKVTENPSDDSLEKVLSELNELIGLKAVKTDVNELINLLAIQKKRTTKRLKNIEFSLHTVFLGPPGTGKTTVARLLSRIYKHLGFLSEGQMFETDREGLVAGYVGQTATKVDEAVKHSLGGVLFIDEAYALTQSSASSDYGAEAVNTLIKRMEDHRDDLAVVVAGYTEPMKQFIESNPGLRSRFNRYFYFDHFTPEELMQIFESFCKSSDFLLTDAAKEKLADTFSLLYEKKDESFGNARVARNLFEKCIQKQANRIVKLSKHTQKVLKTLEEEDIPEPNETRE